MLIEPRGINCAYLCNMFRTLVHIWCLFFALTSLMPGNDVRNLFRFSGLFEHYEEHLAESPTSDMSFVEFTLLHFGTSDHRTSGEEHEQLPFQGASSSLLLFVDELPVLVFASNVPETAGKVFFYMASYATPERPSPFRPPLA